MASTSATAALASSRLQARLGRQEPASRDQGRHRLPGVLVVGRHRHGVGGGGGPAASDPRPEIELPVHREHAALQPRAVAGHLGAAARQQVRRRVQLGAGHSRLQQRLLDARRAHSQVCVVCDGFGHREHELIVLKRDDPVVSHDPGGRAGGCPVRGYGRRRHGFRPERRGIRWRLHRARRHRDEQAGRQQCREPANAATGIHAGLHQCRLMLCLMMT